MHKLTYEVLIWEMNLGQNEANSRIWVKNRAGSHFTLSRSKCVDEMKISSRASIYGGVFGNRWGTRPPKGVATDSGLIFSI